MISFQGQDYELFFSNALPPLIALNYADEQFFKEFESLCGKRYRILSVIRKGWQQKYGRSQDITKLSKQFESKISDSRWPQGLLKKYEKKSIELRKLLKTISKKNYKKATAKALAADIKRVREKSAVLDAMSNMLHLFSSTVGPNFYKNLQNYSSDTDLIKENFVFYTQPIKESRFAKIKVKKLKQKIKLSKKDENFSNVLRIGAFVKDDVSELLDLRKKLMQNLFKDVAKRLKCKPADLEYLQINEIKQFLSDNENPKSLIRQRRKISILFYPQKKLQVFEGAIAEKFLKKSKLKEKAAKKVKVLQGQTASLGKAMGKAIIALTSAEAVTKVKKGDILVAPYTAVEYLPAIKKAIAIITETGGITSHAAIVSREMKIPCIIAVKDATRLIKNGQKIEVNADKNKIKLLD
jgi:phosphohistidine swiveling domain-containing protein